MRHISFILLTLPDGRLVLQRRDSSVRNSPKLLGLFGGHVEQGETYDGAMVREFKEETSLNLDNLQWGFVQDFQRTPKGESEATLHLYWAEVPGADFEVYEGAGAEVYERKEALARHDLTPSCKYVLENILKEK